MKQFFLRTFGCQMNVSDSEIVEAILTDKGYTKTDDIKSADVILFNTCSIRDKAEQSLYKQISQINNKRHVVGILGCMSQRLKEQLLENKHIDFVVGVDQYRNLPTIIEHAFISRQVVAEFDNTEFYVGIRPKYSNKISAFVPIIRGCNNYCTYCVVPYTRGREKSRVFNSIVDEVKYLYKNGYKEITLLGENVNSYCYDDNDFADLLQCLAEEVPCMRIRFTSSNPQDISLKIIKTIKAYDNICKHIHLPLQSGSNRMLKLMNRKYSREEYIDKISMIRSELPDCAITTDIICGFCGETDDDHQQTLDMMQQVQFDSSFMFAYSQRSGTYAAQHMADDVPYDIKIQRLNDVVALQRTLSEQQNAKCVGKEFEILVEGPSKKNKNHYFGRTMTNKVVIFDNNNHHADTGDTITVKIIRNNSATLFGF